MPNQEFTLSFDEISKELSECFDSEEQYELLIELGDELPEMPEEWKVEENRVQGCTSRVWIVAKDPHEKRLRFSADSDALIVKGLIALLISMVNQRTPQEILSYDIEGEFEKLNLERHLSRSRSNGFFSMIRRIRDLAQAAQEVLDQSA